MWEVFIHALKSSKKILCMLFGQGIKFGNSLKREYFEGLHSFYFI